MADAPLTAALEEIKDRYAKATAGLRPEVIKYWDCADVKPLLAAVQAVLKDHEPATIFQNADHCGHPQPEESSSEWDEWAGDHPYGSSAGGEGGDIQICLLTPMHQACPACSKLVFNQWGDDDGFIDASDCIVRPAITRELTGDTGKEAGDA